MLEAKMEHEIFEAIINIRLPFTRISTNQEILLKKQPQLCVVPQASLILRMIRHFDGDE